jgi:hypothetical protein
MPREDVTLRWHLKNGTGRKNRCSINLIMFQRNPYISEIRF